VRSAAAVAEACMRPYVVRHHAQPTRGALSAFRFHSTLTRRTVSRRARRSCTATSSRATSCSVAAELPRLRVRLARPRARRA